MHKLAALSLTLIPLLAGPLGAQKRPGLYDESVLRTFDLRFSQSDWWQQLFNNRLKKVYIRADLTADGVTYKDVGVRFRGHSSWEGVKGKDKKPFKISMDEFVPGRKLYGHRTINLNNNFIDPTHIREPLAYWVLRRFMPAPRCNFVKLTLNGQNWGLYINAEQLNKDFLDDHFEDNDGNRYRAEWQENASNTNSAMTWLGPSHDPYKKAYELKTESAVNPWFDLVNVIDKLNNSGGAIETELPKVLDVDNAIRLLVGTNLIPLHDSYTHVTPHNYYLYGDPHHQRFALIPWDVNNSFGDYPWMTIQQKMQLDPFYAANRSDRPLLNKVVTRHNWRQRFLAHFRAALNDVYDWNVIGAKVAAYQKLIAPVLNNDPKRLYPMNVFWDSFVKDVKVEIWVAGLKPFVEGRSRFLKNHAELRKAAPVIDWINHSPSKPSVKDWVLIQAKVQRPQDIARADVRYRTTGTFQRVTLWDDGQHGDGQAGDGLFGNWIPKQSYGTKVEYYVEAENNSVAGGAWAFAPRYASHRPSTYRVEWPRADHAIHLAEFMARNLTGARDEVGEFEDWLELRNATNQDVSIAGMYLTDDIEQPTKWRIPDPTTVGGWQEVLIWADDEPLDGRLHATFKLSAGGEELALFDRDGVTLLDHIEFGQQRADVSSGRIEDYRAPWVTYLDATPGAHNTIWSCGHRRFSGFRPDRHWMALDLIAPPKIGSLAFLRLGRAPANSAGLILFAAQPGDVPIAQFGISLLFRSPILGTLLAPTDATGNGSAVLPIPDDQRLVGTRLTFMTVAADQFGIMGSNGVEIFICNK